MPLPSSSLRMLAPAAVKNVATRITTRVALIGTSPTFSQKASNALNCTFLYLSSCTRAGTISMERTNVVEMPSSRVVPTVRMGSMGTRLGQRRTLNPMMVVSADRKIAWPVVSTARTVAMRLMWGSHGSTSSVWRPSLWAAHVISSRSSIRSILFSSIRFVRWRA